MTFFQEVYDRIRCATNARTQTELAAVLDTAVKHFGCEASEFDPFRLVHETV